MRILLILLLLVGVASAQTTTTSTSTTSSTSTSTLLFTKYLFPAPMGAASNTMSSTIDEMFCADLTATATITNATHFFGIQTAVCSSGNSGWALYPPTSNGQRLATTGAQSCLSLGLKPASGTITAFSIISGNTYRVCVCGPGSGAYLGARDSGVALAAGLFRNAFATRVGRAATFCGTSGCLPGSGQPCTVKISKDVDNSNTGVEGMSFSLLQEKFGQFAVIRRRDLYV